MENQREKRWGKLYLYMPKQLLITNKKGKEIPKNILTPKGNLAKSNKKYGITFITSNDNTTFKSVIKGSGFDFADSHYYNVIKK